jgi:hypothetical protein
MRRAVNLPGTGPGGRPGEIEFRELRYFAAAHPGGTAIAVMAEAAARALCAGGLAVVPVQPPPQYVLALAWRRGEQAAAAQRFLAYLRTYRDRHQRITGPQLAPSAHDGDPASLPAPAEHSGHRTTCPAASVISHTNRYRPGRPHDNRPALQRPQRDSTIGGRLGQRNPLLHARARRRPGAGLGECW